VFLEIYIDKRWQLLDAQAQRIYPAYDPKMRILPEYRWAYDKGGEPYSLILSMRWEEWLKQTRDYFRDFDLAQLPVIGGHSIRPHVSVAGNGAEWILERCRAQGFLTGMSFNQNFDKWMPAIAGGILVLTCIGEDFALPEKYHKSHSPLSIAEIRDALKMSPRGSARRTLDDGTKVFLLYGRTDDDLKKAVEELKFE